MPSIVQIINGNRYDFSSIELSFSILPGVAKVVGCKEITYKETLDPGMVYGTSADPIGRTRGQYSAEGSISIYRAEFRDLMIAIQAQNPPTGAKVPGYLELTFDVTVSYAEPGQPVIVDRLLGCRFKTLDSSNSQGKDSSLIKADLSIMKILQANQSPLAFPLSSLGIPSK